MRDVRQDRCGHLGRRPLRTFYRGPPRSAQIFLPHLWEADGKLASDAVRDDAEIRRIRLKPVRSERHLAARPVLPGERLGVRRSRVSCAARYVLRVWSRVSAKVRPDLGTAYGHGTEEKC